MPSLKELWVILLDLLGGRGLRVYGDSQKPIHLHEREQEAAELGAQEIGRWRAQPAPRPKLEPSHQANPHLSDSMSCQEDIAGPYPRNIQGREQMRRALRECYGSTAEGEARTATCA